MTSILTPNKRIYVSGKISGRPANEARIQFLSACRMLISVGYDALDPHDIGACRDKKCDGKNDPKQSDGYEHSWTCYLKYDLIDMIKCDGVAMLPGWEESRGARLEWNTAKELEIPVHTVDWWIQEAYSNATR